MNIILEGPDGGGKSTLARALMAMLSPLDYRLQGSEGPAKSRDEIIERTRRYMDFKVPTLFDRHPIVSQVIYQSIRPEPEWHEPVFPQAMLDEFYAQDNLYIYCRATDISTDHHELKDYDTEEHVDNVYAQFKKLVALYDVWALRHATYIHRIGQEVLPLIHYIHGTIIAPSTPRPKL